jgi:hypothetical protein
MFQEALELGAFSVLNKPFDLLQLPELAARARQAKLC